MERLGQFLRTGRIGRSTYVWWGALLVVIKYNLDRVVMASFGRGPFFPWSYWLPHSGQSLTEFVRAEPGLFWALGLSAFPFALGGLALTVARLRSVGWPIPLVGVFFVPVVNALFFAMLSVVPPTDVRRATESPGCAGWLRWILPKGRLATAGVAVVMVALVSVILVALSVEVMASYGWGLFCGIPFAAGFLAVMLAAVRERVPAGQAAMLSVMTPLVTGGLLLAFAVEGLICILMAAPIGLVMALVGGMLAYVIQDQAWELRRGGAAMGAMLVALPAMFFAESQMNDGPLRACVTEVVIGGSREAVWEEVVAFSRIPEPTEWVFHTGIAYPIDAVIEGEGVGAVRRCRFSTGDFVEPITVWDWPKRLAFSVESMPEPMREISPYRAIHPPHLEGFLVSERGEFLLTEQADGRTRLRGTTWYRQRLWPQGYWTVFSDYLLHAIHRRVLEHIRDEVEAG